MDGGLVADRVKQYLVENYLYTRADYELGLRDPLLGSGILDSMGVVEVLEFVQAEFGVTVADDEITEANFGTVADIASFVVRKRT